MKCSKRGSRKSKDFIEHSDMIEVFNDKIIELNKFISECIDFEVVKNTKELVKNISRVVSFRYFDEYGISEFPHKGFRLLDTAGDNSCLIHSVLLALSSSYRIIPDDEQCECSTFGTLEIRSYIGKYYRTVKLIEYTNKDPKNIKLVKNVKRFLGSEHLHEIANELEIIIVLFSYNVEKYKSTGETVKDNIVIALGNDIQINENTPVIFIYGDGYHFSTMIYRSIHAGFGETGSSTVMKFKDALKISLEMEKLLKCLL